MDESTYFCGIVHFVPIERESSIILLYVIILLGADSKIIG